MKKQFGDYYMGLDIGTDSVGWAVTDLQYNLMKLNGKALWGIRLFENAQTAESRRLFRTARRRLARRKERLNILQEFFAEAIAEKDPAFFQRMKESKYWLEDKELDQPDTLFCDPKYKDKDFHKAYPTIYHLRKALIEGGNEFDIRLIYLAIHNILKHRGHFQFAGQSLSHISNFDTVFRSMEEYLREYMNVDYEGIESERIGNILKDKSLGINKKKNALSKALPVENAQQKEIVAVLSGGKGRLALLFDDDSYKDAEVNSISFSSGNWDEEWDTLQDILGDNRIAVESMKAVYDWGVLAEILNGHQYLSHSKVQVYEQHKEDLIMLKKVIRDVAPGKYKEIFSDTTKGLANYTAYIGATKTNHRKQRSEASRCSQEDLCKYLEKILKDKMSTSLEFQVVMSRIAERTLLPKQIIKDNGVIPYQLHKVELEKILDNAATYCSFLNEADSSGLSVKEKIVKLLEFRVPYFVGPLNPAHKESGFAWVERKAPGKVYPWNFEEKVDVQKSAEKFILKMTNKCTYLIQADVLPRNSLLYSKFTVLNELNNLRINGEPISLELKQGIYQDLFEKKKKVTLKQLVAYLKTENILNQESDAEISGIDGDFKSSLASLIDLKSIIGDKVGNTDMAEEIIRNIVLFGEDKKMLAYSIKSKFESILNDEEIKALGKLKFTGWGRLSKEFLLEITSPDKQTGEYKSILAAMWENENNPNLMQLLSGQYGYLEAIEEYNQSSVTDSGKLTYDKVDELYISPSVKRMLWQTLTIVAELRKVMGHDPRKVFIEMARGPEEKKRTISRKESLIALYKACQIEEKDWIKELEGKDEREFRRDRLYLYYTQLGRCLYSGEAIDISNIYDNKYYDVDHIYPQSSTKDDSLDNRVLVKKEYNAEKSDSYPIKAEWRNKQRAFWQFLLGKDFISRKKFDRLIRNTPLSEDELAGFINRQIVETRQTTKAAAQLLGDVLDSEIVYVKAGNVSSFRQTYDLLKVRSVNDLHHAKDAFLNIVVGNVYDTKFTKNAANFIKINRQNYNLNRMYEFDVKRGDTIAWRAGDGGTIGQIKKTMLKNNVLFTRYAFEKKGGFYDQMLMSKGSGQIPIKGGDPRFSDISKYGGYNKAAGAYFSLVESIQKKDKVLSIEAVPVYLAAQIEESQTTLEVYFESQGLVNPRVIIPKIKINALFEVDGFRMHLSGRSNERLLFWHAIQLHLPKDKELYIKKLEKYAEFCLARNKKIGELAIDEYDAISIEQNNQLFDTFINKLQIADYKKRYKTQLDTLIEKKEKFTKLTIERQSALLLEITTLFQCNSVVPDLSLIGGPSRAGILTLSKIISKDVPIYLIHQSSSGIFEEKIKLEAI